MAKHTYEVIVGNIGSVHVGTNQEAARKVWREYVAQSKSNRGRASSEAVTIMRDGDIWLEYEGTLPQEDL